MTQINAMFGNTRGDGSTDLQQVTKQAHKKTFVTSMQVTKKYQCSPVRTLIQRKTIHHKCQNINHKKSRFMTLS